MRFLHEVSTKELDWRNPEMPNLRPAYDNLREKEIILAQEPKEAQAEASFNLLHSDVPDWRNDPTYNMRRRKR